MSNLLDNTKHLVKERKHVNGHNRAFKASALAKDMLNKRKELNLSTRDAAKQAKIDPGVFNRMEFGKPANFENFRLVCNWLGTHVQAYF
jgi:hypothetical protein